MTAPLALTTFADIACFGDWVRRAQPGEEAIYATGPVLGEHPVGRAARSFAERRLVELFQRRSPRAGCFDYCARKREVAATRPDGALEPASMSPDELRVFVLVSRAARLSAPCPSLACIAHRCGMRDRFQARRALDRLVELGVLIKHPRPADAPHDAPSVFEVAQTGDRTADGGTA